MINPLDPVGWLMGIASAVSGWYTESVKQTIEILLTRSLPSPEDIQSGFFTLALGGSFGLSTFLVSVITIFIGAAILFRPNHDHRNAIGRQITSFIWLILFALLFYRGYGLLYGLLQGGGQGALNLMTGSNNGTIAELNGLLLVAAPGAVGGLILLGPLAVLFSYIAMAEAFILYVALFGLLIAYPLLIALRPLPVFNTLFHAANALVAVVLISPTVMAWGFALPVVISNNVIGGGLAGVRVVLTFVCSFLAAAIPLFLGTLIFTQSRKVFGTTESKVEGMVAISSMPSVDLKEVNRDIDQVRVSPLKAIAADVIGDEILQGNMFRDFGKVAVNAAATGFAAAGHPYVSVAIKAAPTVVGNVKERFAPSTEVESFQEGRESS